MDGMDNLGSHVDSYLNDDYMLQDDLDGSDQSDDSCNDGQSKNTPLREQDRFLPIANIAKIMKRAIPENGKIAKDARECIQECVSEFISFITSEASDRCHQEKRKTINGEDILFAMCSLGFDSYIEPLTLYLHKYRETTKSDRNLTILNETPRETTFDNTSSANGYSIQTQGPGTTVTGIQAVTTNDVSIPVTETILYYQQNGSTRSFQL